MSRSWASLVVAVALTAIVTVLAAIVISVVYVNGVLTERFEQVSAEQARVVCHIARTNHTQLLALREISDVLGLPTHFAVPDIPEGCE